MQSSVSILHLLWTVQKYIACRPFKFKSREFVTLKKCPKKKFIKHATECPIHEADRYMNVYATEPHVKICWACIFEVWCPVLHYTSSLHIMALMYTVYSGWVGGGWGGGTHCDGLHCGCEETWKLFLSSLYCWSTIIYMFNCTKVNKMQPAIR